MTKLSLVAVVMGVLMSLGTTAFAADDSTAATTSGTEATTKVKKTKKEKSKKTTEKKKELSEVPSNAPVAY